MITFLILYRPDVSNNIRVDDFFFQMKSLTEDSVEPGNECHVALSEKVYAAPLRVGGGGHPRLRLFRKV